MRILLDESLPIELRDELPGHSVSSVQEMGWSALEMPGARSKIPAGKLKPGQTIVHVAVHRLDDTACAGAASIPICRRYNPNPPQV